MVGSSSRKVQGVVHRGRPVRPFGKLEFVVTPVIEFSHIVSIEPWPDDGIIVDLLAGHAELQSLKSRFGLVDLRSLNASGRIEKAATTFVLSGMIEAEVVQSCVVTLQPVASTLQTPFERHYRPLAIHEKMAASEPVADTLDEMPDIDVLEGDAIDVGEAITEEFYLALDPYPRAAHADRFLADMQDKTADLGGDKTDNPFEKLRQH